MPPSGGYRSPRRPLGWRGFLAAAFAAARPPTLYPAAALPRRRFTPPPHLHAAAGHFICCAFSVRQPTKNVWLVVRRATTNLPRRAPARSAGAWVFNCAAALPRRRISRRSPAAALPRRRFTPPPHLPAAAGHFLNGRYRGSVARVCVPARALHEGFRG